MHFLANSLFGLSVYIEPPSKIHYHGTDSLGARASSSSDFGCWSAFRTGEYRFPKTTKDFTQTSYTVRNFPYDTIRVEYRIDRCEQYLNQTRDLTVLTSEYRSSSSYQGSYKVGNCESGDEVVCTPEGDMKSKCRLNVRMQAAFILAGCLSIKALYMIVVIVRARKRQKSQILTFGDAVVASTLDPALQVHGECLVNAEEGHRIHTDHTCHKHCRSSEPSPTGDDIGHCQKCKKFNTYNRSADLPHPAIAIKFKKSLLANLGGTALTQMITLMFSSLIMLAFTLTLAVFMGADAASYNSHCSTSRSSSSYNSYDCASGVTAYMASHYGTWGGYNQSGTIAYLSPDSLESEQIAFWVSNGAQLVYSTLYLLLIYNLTLISMEHDWGKFELAPKKLRSTLVRGEGFTQSYLLQLPKRILFPSMGFSALMHWLLAQSISTQEVTWADKLLDSEHSQYKVRFHPLALFTRTFPHC